MTIRMHPGFRRMLSLLWASAVHWGDTARPASGETHALLNPYRFRATFIPFRAPASDPCFLEPFSESAGALSVSREAVSCGSVTKTAVAVIAVPITVGAINSHVGISVARTVIAAGMRVAARVASGHAAKRSVLNSAPLTI